MAMEYSVEPRKLSEDGREVIPAEDNDAQFYGVYVRGINEHWGVGGKGPDSDKLLNHIEDFPTREEAQAFMERLQANVSQMKEGKPVTVAGVRYLPSIPTPDDGKPKYYTAEGGLGAGFQMPAVSAWEIDRYLKTGQLSPELAANAVAHPENLVKLDDFDRLNLKKFAQEANVDPDFADFRKIEGAYYRDMGMSPDSEGVMRTFTLDDMPKELRDFVTQNRDKATPAVQEAPTQEAPKVLSSPMGGLDLAGIAEGVTLLYSRADSPDILRTGVLMHNDSTAGGQRLDVFSNHDLRERLYTGEDQGHTPPGMRLAAVLGYAEPTNEPIFVAGVGADGKIVENPKDAQSFGIFYHDKDGEAVPVGQAVTAELAEQLKNHIEQGRVPQPVENLQTLSSLKQLRDLLDMPEPEPAEKFDAKQPTPDKQPNHPQPQIDPQQNPQPQNNPQQQNNQQQNNQQQNIVRISLMAALLMHTANAGRNIARAIRGPDAEEWQHRAHAHMDRAQAHLDAIARHPAVQEYQKMEALQGVPDRAKAIYADTLLRNNPDLAAHFAQAKDSVDKAQEAVFQANKKGSKTDPALTEKAGMVYATASKLPDMEGGVSGGLFSSLKSFFSTQQTLTMRKP